MEAGRIEMKKDAQELVVTGAPVVDADVPDNATALARELGADPAQGQDRLPGAWIVEKLPYVPIAFVGLAFYRAWIELVFVGSFISFPSEGEAVHDVFDFVMVIALFVFAALSRRIGVFYKHSVVYWACGILMCTSTICVFVTLLYPSLAPTLAIPSSVLGGFGTAIVILLWSELYSCLPPYKVGVYYCASIVVAALVLYLCRGLADPWNAAMGVLLPLVSLACCALGFMSLPAAERPRSTTACFSFPWKPTLLMAIYAFAFSLHEASQYAAGFGPHSAPGTLVIAFSLLVLMFLRGSEFDYSMLYRIALPLMMAAFLLLPAFGGLSSGISNFCAMAGYTAFSVLIMLILANMSYRYGISAVWLFGIERGVRALFTIFGRQAAAGIVALNLGGSESLVLGGATALLVLVGTIMFVSEKDFQGRWGVSFKGGSSLDERAELRREDIEARCQDLASSFGLTERETQVLLLLAQGKTAGQVQRDLVISRDTVKTHVKHIYRKLDVHSRAELADLVGVSSV